MENTLKFHVNLEVVDDVEDVHTMFAVDGADVAIFREGGHDGVLPHWQGLIEYEKPIEDKKKLVKKIRNSMNYTWRAKIKSVLNSDGKVKKHTTSIASFKNKENYENYRTYLCKGPSKETQITPNVVYQGPYSDEEIQSRHQYWWTHRNLKEAKGNIKKNKKQTIGEQYFEYMESLDPDDIKTKENIYLATTIFFAKCMKSGYYNPIIGYANSWVASKSSMKNPTQMHMDIICKLMDLESTYK